MKNFRIDRWCVRGGALDYQLSLFGDPGLRRAGRGQGNPSGCVGHGGSAAIKYAVNNWTALTVFLEHVNVRLENNVSEQQLRIIALGRDNYLLVGHDLAGENLAVLQLLVNTCELNGVNHKKLGHFAI